MAILFKCKACGGNLEDIIPKSSIYTCQYCGTTQTVPVFDDEKKLAYFNRANKLRLNNEFDSAARIYENIVAEFQDESEAYWGLCLCKYGIEYVDDPLTGKKVPTCHRTSYTSIFDDDDFAQALENSSGEKKTLYRNEAKEIDRLQKSILEVASKEAPFDVFICYKETDGSGQRTRDSVIAQDIYDALTVKGYKVFFSRITLEDVLGKEYEPYIFSALNSSKVMLAIGSCYEYFDSVWVKNEWSRFLKMMQMDKSKTLIPCYIDIDAYDMPSEFRNLQGQDLSKVGCIQDLVRGVGKLLAVQISSPSQVTSGASIESLMTRVEDFLVDKEWQHATSYCEKILDMNPRYSKAYAYKLMANFKLSKINQIDYCLEDFRSRADYRKLVEYANDEVKTSILPHFEKAYQARCEKVYSEAMQLKDSIDVETVSRAGNLFASIHEWKDANEKYKECMQRRHGLIIMEKEQEIREAKKELSKNRASMIFSIILAILTTVTFVVFAKSDMNAEESVHAFIVFAITSVVCLGATRVGIIKTIFASLFTFGLAGLGWTIIDAFRKIRNHVVFSVATSKEIKDIQKKIQIERDMINDGMLF
ncbi:MAG: toll/interleukin-1 receptor domain-containing protein [Huintestinicola sp.]